MSYIFNYHLYMYAPRKVLEISKEIIEKEITIRLKHEFYFENNSALRFSCRIKDHNESESCKNLTKKIKKILPKNKSINLLYQCSECVDDKRDCVDCNQPHCDGRCVICKVCKNYDCRKCKNCYCDGDCKFCNSCMKFNCDKSCERCEHCGEFSCDCKKIICEFEIGTHPKVMEKIIEFMKEKYNDNVSITCALERTCDCYYSFVIKMPDGSCDCLMTRNFIIMSIDKENDIILHSKCCKDKKDSIHVNNKKGLLDTFAKNQCEISVISNEPESLEDVYEHLQKEFKNKVVFDKNSIDMMMIFKMKVSKKWGVPCNCKDVFTWMKNICDGFDKKNIDISSECYKCGREYRIHVDKDGIYDDYGQDKYFTKEDYNLSIEVHVRSEDKIEEVKGIIEDFIGDTFIFENPHDKFIEYKIVISKSDPCNCEYIYKKILELLKDKELYNSLGSGCSLHCCQLFV